jgi:PhnB protein
MDMNPYVSFKGDCEAAFKLYERCLGGRIRALFRYAETPLSGEVAADWQNKIMHGSMVIAGQVLMGADVAPERYEAPQGFSLSLQMNGVAEAERVFRELSEGGKILVELEETFWAKRFGIVVDCHGIPWLINSEGTSQ